MNGLGSFLSQTTHADAILTGILIACAVMLILLVKALLDTRAAAAKVAQGNEELVRINEVVCTIQNRIGVSYRKLEVLTTIDRTLENPALKNEDDDFRERLTRS